MECGSLLLFVANDISRMDCDEAAGLLIAKGPQAAATLDLVSCRSSHLEGREKYLCSALEDCSIQRSGARWSSEQLSTQKRLSPSKTQECESQEPNALQKRKAAASINLSRNLLEPALIFKLLSSNSVLVTECRVSDVFGSGFLFCSTSRESRITSVSGSRSSSQDGSGMEELGAPIRQHSTPEPAGAHTVPGPPLTVQDGLSGEQDSAAGKPGHEQS
ncbi:uncharacterized protein LOC112946791 [Nothoprocta perdicaria]|uniref:uncharacterized protein LOC112946791 n=1 Tax=Nothoprocta perdicaria TaxID=30464 RepID=UPI000E1BB109|nr:uncharacterized protein LOC112946791 [Nothoprocta perdicaria]